MSLSNLKETLDGRLLLDNRRRQHCQESIQVSRSLSITLNSYLSRRLGREYPVNAHAYRLNLPTELSKDDSLELQLQAKSHSFYSHNDYE